MDVNTVIALINQITASASALIAKLLAVSGLTAEEIRAKRDALSADTHALVDAELAKLPAVK